VVPSQIEFAREDVRDAGPAVRPTVKKTRTGKVTVRVNPWAEVHFGGRKLGTTPLPPVEVPAGTATFVLKNAQHGEGPGGRQRGVEGGPVQEMNAHEPRGLS
jgi:hypothetical protein